MDGKVELLVGVEVCEEYGNEINKCSLEDYYWFEFGEDVIIIS